MLFFFRRWILHPLLVWGAPQRFLLSNLPAPPNALLASACGKPLGQTQQKDPPKKVQTHLTRSSTVLGLPFVLFVGLSWTWRTNKQQRNCNWNPLHLRVQRGLEVRQMLCRVAGTFSTTERSRPCQFTQGPLGHTPCASYLFDVFLARETVQKDWGTRVCVGRKVLLALFWCNVWGLGKINQKLFCERIECWCVLMLFS